MKTCIKCGVKLLPNKNWASCLVKKHDYICNNCKKVRHNIWRKNNQKHTLLIMKNYYQECKEKIREQQQDYYQRHKDEICANVRKYYKTEVGRIVDRKHQAKRKRNLGFIPLMSNPFPNEIEVDYHHINNVFVIPVPRQVHKSMYGNNHRVKVNNWIEEIIGDVGVC